MAQTFPVRDMISWQLVNHRQWQSLLLHTFAQFYTNSAAAFVQAVSL